MSFTLLYPCSIEDRADFVAAHQGLTPVETDTALYFLEAHEAIASNGTIVDLSTDTSYLAGVLASAQSAACASIDATAETLRNRVLTPGSGQMAAYQAKEVQATALLADAAPTAAAYPDIYNEVGITADTATNVAKAVLAAAEQWRVFGRAIERARLGGKMAVNAAIDVAGVTAAKAAIAWPSV